MLSTIGCRSGHSYIFSAPIEKTRVNYDRFLTVKANEYRVKDFGYYSGWDNIASFNVLNGTIRSCEPLTEALYLEWKAGQYEPNWVEADHGSYEYRKANLPPGMIGPMYGRYFLFSNQDSYDKVVHIQVTAYWDEPNTQNLMIGIVLIVIGLGTGSGLTIMYMRKSALPLRIIPQF